MIVTKIISNKLKCNKCGDIIQSEYGHDFKWCSCGAVAVDGGKDYLRRVGDFVNATDLSEVEEIEIEDRKPSYESNT